MRIRVVQTGHLVGNATFLRGEGWGSLLRRAVRIEFPAYCFVLEHPDGHIAIDAGVNARARTQRLVRRFAPTLVATPDEEVGPRMRAVGLRPEDVRLVIPTHLDWDHVGGIGHFTNAKIAIHRPEMAFARSLKGRVRYQPALWPDGFEPELYDLEPEPLGPFPASRAMTDDGVVRVVPTPGHSAGHVGVVVEAGSQRLFFAGDHMLRRDWFLSDVDAGRLVQLGVYFRRDAIETSRRIHRYVADHEAVLVPAHDDEVGARLAAAGLLVDRG